MIGIPFLPRSPRWLFKVGRCEEALDTLAFIQAKGNKNDPVVVAEFEDITEAVRVEERAPRSWRKFVYNGMWRRTLAAMSVQAWQQLSGANVIVYYEVYVIQMAGVTGNANLLASGVQYALFLVFTALTFFIIDRVGRRPLLVYGILMMAVCHFIIGGVLGTYGTYVDSVAGNPNVKVQVSGQASRVVIAFSYILICIYALTIAPGAWVYAGEAFSLATRGKGMALAACANWLFNFALGLFVPPAFATISWKTFLVFGALCLGGAIQAFLTYPETAHKSLEEIEFLFSNDGPKPWHTKVGQSKLDENIRNRTTRGVPNDAHEDDGKQEV